MRTYEKALTALADPTRRALIETLARQPCSVTELADEHPVSRPAVSQHLKVLQDASLVKVTPKGTRRIYALDPTGLAHIRTYLDQFWNEALGAYAAEVKRRTQI